eukprot:c8130_g1_i2.p1 GENE.c8130_g1_i2~~c8130_g1_i2.p1  ORF type:complete len:185 (+),score=28.88 c8130_g1_i2:42-557(+)
MYDSIESARKSTKNALSRVTGQPQEPTMWTEIETNCCPSLTKEQRIYGFVFCFCLGVVITFVGYLTLVTGNILSFAVLYTLGNLISLFSSAFIVGPLRQVKTMFHPTRRIATCVYFIAMALTLVVAFTSGRPVLCILMIVVQWCALVWYILSYIPYGRKMVTSCCKTAIGV